MPPQHHRPVNTKTYIHGRELNGAPAGHQTPDTGELDKRSEQLLSLTACTAAPNKANAYNTTSTVLLRLMAAAC
jgi:hypothetical protein